ncbi:hypothetical protein [Streptomyces sp. NPDC056194]
MSTDALAAWGQVRARIDWTSAAGEVPPPVEPIMDGIAAWCGEGGPFL